MKLFISNMFKDGELQAVNTAFLLEQLRDPYYVLFFRNLSRFSPSRKIIGGVCCSRWPPDTLSY
jgi:hypothetical protein